jgi:hypothetical protein
MHQTIGRKDQAEGVHSSSKALSLQAMVQNSFVQWQDEGHGVVASWRCKCECHKEENGTFALQESKKFQEERKEI